MLPAALTAGVFCTALQYGYNEFRIMRIKSLANRRNPSPTLVQHSAEVVDERPRWLQRLLSAGITKVPEEEYLERLKAQRDKILVRIKELEQEGGRKDKK